MSQGTRLRVFCYDISSDRRRRRVAAILEDYATRVQGSVFEARLGNRVVEKIIDLLTPHIADADNLRVYTIGKTGARYCEVIGAGPAIESEGDYWIV